MKKIVPSLAALAMMAGSAVAADLPSRKGPMLPPPPPPPLWTGFYVGLNAGGGWASSTSTTLSAVPLFNLAPGNPSGVASAGSATQWISGNGGSGFIGGGQIGYNWQFYNNFLIGAEADIQGIAGSGGKANALGAGLEPGIPTNFFTSTQTSRSVDYIGTVRGRLGWLFTPTLLIYGTGGLAYGGVNLSTTYFTSADGVFYGPGAGAGTFANTLAGWTAGGGVEWMFMPNWSAKVEYLYYDLGSVRTPGALVSGPNPAGGNPLGWAYGAQSSTHFSGNIVRAGLNYHFNWASAPVVAKY